MALKKNELKQNRGINALKDKWLGHSEDGFEIKDYAKTGVARSLHLGMDPKYMQDGSSAFTMTIMGVMAAMSAGAIHYAGKIDVDVPHDTNISQELGQHNSAQAYHNDRDKYLLVNTENGYQIYKSTDDSASDDRYKLVTNPVNAARIAAEMSLNFLSPDQLEDLKTLKYEGISPMLDEDGEGKILYRIADNIAADSTNGLDLDLTELKTHHDTWKAALDQYLEAGTLKPNVDIDVDDFAAEDLRAYFDTLRTPLRDHLSENGVIDGLDKNMAKLDEKAANPIAADHYADYFAPQAIGLFFGSLFSLMGFGAAAGAATGMNASRKRYNKSNKKQPTR